MNYSKRYLTLSGDGEKVTLFFERYGLRTTIKPLSSLSGFDFLLISDGEKIEKRAVNGLIAADIDLSGEVYLFLYGSEKKAYLHVGNKFLSGEKLFDEYKKLSFDEEKTEEKKAASLPRYDDELIAEENYFLKERRNGKDLDDKDADAQKGSFLEQENAVGVPYAPKNDDNLGACEKPPAGTARAQADRQQDKDALYERGGQREKVGLEKLLESFPEEAPLKRVYPFGRFARVISGDKNFIVGKIVHGGKTYYLVGTDGKRSAFLKENPKKSFFVPLSPLSKADKGYFLSFLTDDGEDYVVRKF